MNKYPVDSAPLFHLDGFGLLARAATRVVATRKKSWRSGERGQRRASERRQRTLERVCVSLLLLSLLLLLLLLLVVLLLWFRFGRRTERRERRERTGVSSLLAPLSRRLREEAGQDARRGDAQVRARARARLPGGGGGGAGARGAARVAALRVHALAARRGGGRLPAAPRLRAADVRRL